MEGASGLLEWLRSVGESTYRQTMHGRKGEGDDAVLGLVDGGCSTYRSAISFSQRHVWKELDSGVWQQLSSYSGLMSLRSRSMFATPSRPFSAAPQSGVWP